MNDLSLPRNQCFRIRKAPITRYFFFLQFIYSDQRTLVRRGWRKLSDYPPEHIWPGECVALFWTPFLCSPWVTSKLFTLSRYFMIGFDVAFFSFWLSGTLFARIWTEVYAATTCPTGPCLSTLVVVVYLALLLSSSHRYQSAQLNTLFPRDVSESAQGRRVLIMCKRRRLFTHIAWFTSKRLNQEGCETN